LTVDTGTIAEAPQPHARRKRAELERARIGDASVRATPPKLLFASSHAASAKITPCSSDSCTRCDCIDVADDAYSAFELGFFCSILATAGNKNTLYALMAI
jgi:hypothetical protein